MRVNRSTIGVVVIAFLAVSALGLTAATITTSYSSDIATGGNGGADFDDGDMAPGESGDGQTDRGSDASRLDGEAQDPIEIPQYCVPILTEITGILALLIGFGLLVGVAYWQRGFVAATLSGYLVGLPLLIAYGLLTQCSSPGDDGDSESGIGDIIAQTGLGEGLTSTTVPSVVLGAVFLVAAIGAVAALVMVSGDEEIQPTPDEEEDEPGLSDFAAVAGDAADRIESTDVSVDNAVYRAWQEMTDLLEMDAPETTTPGQFADEAIDAGLDEGDVTDLTELFEEVRYGDMDPEPRGDLAVETLRRIEDTYSGSAETNEPLNEDVDEQEDEDQ